MRRNRKYEKLTHLTTSRFYVAPISLHDGNCMPQWMALILLSCIRYIRYIFVSFGYHLLFSDTLPKNDTSIKTNLIDTVYSMRPENNVQSNAIPNDRKGAVAIGQSVLYTDFPPKDFAGESGELFSFVHIVFDHAFAEINVVLFSANERPKARWVCNVLCSVCFVWPTYRCSIFYRNQAENIVRVACLRGFDIAAK